MDIKTYQRYDGLGLAELIKNKEISAEECVELAITAIENDNPTVNAVNVKDYTRARAQAKQYRDDSLFGGVPFLLKDMVTAREGLPTSCGSRYLADFVWPYDSELVKRYRDAGLIILGKTNAPEFGLSPSSENQFYGDTRNPWDHSRSAGGSSSGAAAAVAVGMVPMAHGTDGGGSIRIPASCCGLFGFKPTRGRVPLGADYGRIWQGFTVHHGITRSVRDSAALLDISEGSEPGSNVYTPKQVGSYLKAIESPPTPLRIAYSTKPFFSAKIDQACIHATEFAAKHCENLGHHVEHVDLQVPEEAVLEASLMMMSSELAAGVKKFENISNKKRRRGDLELTTRAFYRYGCGHLAADLLNAIKTLEQVTRQVSAFFTQYDVLLTPTMAQLPIPLGDLQPSSWEAKILNLLINLPSKRLLETAVLRDAKKIFAYVPYTLLFNITGQPAMSVPMSYAQGLPIGVQFAGAYGADAQLLQLARQIEQVQPWFDNRP